MFKVTPANRKVAKCATALDIPVSRAFQISLPAGYTCLGAKDCLTFAHPKTGKITDGCNQRFRCFAASGEARLPTVREHRWRNFHSLRIASNLGLPLAETILSGVPDKALLVRVHDAGDFFIPEYWAAVCQVARAMPDCIFYGYTKTRLDQRLKPSNMRFVWSDGSKQRKPDSLFTAFVVRSEAEAKQRGLPIDTDDTHAVRADRDFALIIHGPQPTKKGRNLHGKRE